MYVVAARSLAETLQERTGVHSRYTLGSDYSTHATYWLHLRGTK